MKLLDWDTETALFGPGRQAPALSCVSWTQEGAVGLLDHEEALPWFKRKLADKEIVFCGHNVAYDFAVMAAEHPELLPAIFEAYRENRVIDTMLRQQLLDISVGNFRGYWAPCKDKKGHPDWKWVQLNYTLDSCYYRATKKRLDKDTWRLRYGELRDSGVYIQDWPAGAQQYPKQDALATKAAREYQDTLAKEVVDAYAKIPGGHVDYPDPLADQYAQARAGWWIQLMRIWGIKTLPERVDQVEEHVHALIDELKERLMEAGLVRADGSRDTKAAAARMVEAMGGEEKCQKTKKKGIKLDEEACRESGDAILMDYAEYGSLGTVLTKDLPALRKGRDMPIHSNFSVIVATGRTSSSSPNIQNIRRLPGIRECFVPRPGMVFLDCDYDGLELRTLGQVCLSLLGKSKLADTINEGKDPHLMVAAQILKISYEEAERRKKDKDVKDARQLAKCTNFGFPGGLGYETFITFARKGYGVEITVEEAKRLKRNWLLAFPEMEEYFAMVSRHTEEDKDEGLANVEHLFTKRLRGEITYTAACNSYFQGLGADATKAAGFDVAYECYVDESSPLFGCRIVNYIHDQFLVECPEDRCHEAAMRLAEVMEKSAAPFVPDVPATVSEPMVSRCWSKDCEQVWDKMDENGDPMPGAKLIPWDKDFEIKQRGAA